MVMSPVAHAQELSYDRYAPVYKEGKKYIPAKPLAHLLVYPFEFIRWPVDRVLVFIEKYHIPQKVRWGYDTLQDYGVTPHLGSVNFGSPSVGADVDLLRVIRKKEDFPDAIAKSWIRYSDDTYFKVGAELGKERIAGSGFRALTHFHYEERPEEPFFGVGPDTSGGDGALYDIEETALEAVVGYSQGPTFTTDFKLTYRNINVEQSDEDGSGKIGQLATFNDEVVSGIHGDSILSLGFEIVHDTRNHRENSTTGGRERFLLSFNEGVRSSRARYMTYEVEISRYIRLGSDRRVLAVRLLGEHNDELTNGEIPFHQMVKLGGFGRKFRMSETLRGYGANRFTDESLILLNLEYRYTIWEYRDFKVDTVIFWDEGQVFGEFRDLQIGDFRESYGFGFRLSLAQVILFDVELAHGDEGTNLYVKSYAPF